MAEAYKVYPLRCDPGIKRDGTSTEGNNWNEGQWTRFYRGLPRSMLGYRSMTNEFPGPSRGLFVNLNGTGYLDIFSGSSDALSVGQFTTGGFGSGIVDITPSGFATDPNNIWQMDSFFDSNGGGLVDLVAHAAPNLMDIGSSVTGTVYYGDITAAVPLIAAMDDSMSPNPVKVSGGIVCIPPYVVAYGSNGLVWRSDVDNPALFPLANQANPTPTKIVKGMSIRGGASSPAALLWSIDSVLLMSFVGGDTVFNYQTLTDQSSILSSSGVVEMDGIYYWIGIDRWLTYNGVVRELPNEMNLDFFFDNLNFAARQKVFGYKIPRWGEIRWAAPLFGATECNWEIVYNVRENTWYDTPLPSDGRSSAYFAQSWQYPVMGGATAITGATSGFQLWQHEFGTDEVIGNDVNAIESFIISSDLCIVAGSLPPADDPTRWTQLVGFEPDFLYGTQMQIDILTRIFAQDESVVAQSNVMIQGTNYFDTQIQARYLRYKLWSNSQGGYFIMGTPLLRYRQGDQNE